MSGPPLPPPPPGFLPYPSEHDSAPPPGVPVSSATPFAYQTSGFPWSSSVATPASGRGNVDWSRLLSNHSPVGGTLLHGGQGLQSPPTYGGQISMYGGEISNHGGQNATRGNSCVPNLIPAPVFPSSTQSTDAASVRPFATQSKLFQLIDHGNLKNLESIDVTDLVSKLRGLCNEVTQAVGKVLSLIKEMPHDLPRRSLDSKKVHNMAMSHVETVESDGLSEVRRMEADDVNDSNEFLKATILFNDMLKTLEERKSVSNALFYRDAPGVVQIPDFAETECSTLPKFVIGESWAQILPQDTCQDSRAAQKGLEQASILPCRFYQMRKEIFSWTDLPFICTSVQLKALVGLARIKRADLKSWLFTHSGSYGIKFSRFLVDNILVLLILCLRAVQREASTITDYQRRMGKAAPQSVDCRILSESASWLTSQVSLVSDGVASKNLVLGIYKYALEAAAYCLTFPQRGTGGDAQKEEDIKLYREREGDASPQKEPRGSDMILEDLSGTSFSSLSVGDGVLSLHQVAVAIFAIQKEAVLNKCKCAELEDFHSSSAQKSLLHNMAVMKAEEMRATRANYRAVLEHDGLIWHRLQNQEAKKNKSKAEILAEERDYKRRRMSYRGKKVQRTPAEVLRDIIDGHMDEIIAAGGIGVFGRRPAELPSSQSRMELSESGTKDSSFVTADNTRASSRDIPKELGTSHLENRKYSRDSRVPSRIDRDDRHSFIAQSSSRSSYRGRSPYERKQKYERSHDKLDRNRRS